MSPTNAETCESATLVGLADAPRDFSGASLTLRSFLVFSILFSAVPAAALACLAIATARLGSIGAWQSGTLYLFYTMSSVLGATYVVNRLGSRNAVIVGMALYCFYIGCFLIATLDPSSASVFALTGAVIGGMGVGILWTAQGVYFSQAAEAYSLESGIEWSESTSLLAGYFAFILLAEETLLDVASSTLVKVFDVHWSLIFSAYSLIAVGATVSMGFVHNYPSESTNPESTNLEGFSQNGGNFYKLTAAFRLLISDSKMKYMIGFNAAFGFAGAFLNSFVSGEVLPVALHDSSSSYVGLLVAIHGFTAAIFSLLFGRMSTHTGKGSVIIIGSLAFASVAFPFLVRPNIEDWNWGMTILVYVLEGIGRATFEGALKALFADFFPYEKEGAFANIILQNGLASAIGYVLSFRLLCSAPSAYCIEYRDGSLHDLWTFACLVVVCAMLAIVGYLRAAHLYTNGSTGRKVSAYRIGSIRSYRSSRASVQFLDTQTYDYLVTNLEAKAGEELSSIS